MVVYEQKSFDVGVQALSSVMTPNFVGATVASSSSNRYDYCNEDGCHARKESHPEGPTESVGCCCQTPLCNNVYDVTSDKNVFRYTVDVAWKGQKGCWESPWLPMKTSDDGPQPWCLNLFVPTTTQGVVSYYHQLGLLLSKSSTSKQWAPRLDDALCSFAARLGNHGENESFCFATEEKWTYGCCCKTRFCNNFILNPEMDPKRYSLITMTPTTTPTAPTTTPTTTTTTTTTTRTTTSSKGRTTTETPMQLATAKTTATSTANSAAVRNASTTVTEETTTAAETQEVPLFKNSTMIIIIVIAAASLTILTVLCVGIVVFCLVTRMCLPKGRKKRRESKHLDVDDSDDDISLREEESAMEEEGDDEAATDGGGLTAIEEELRKGVYWEEGSRPETTGAGTEEGDNTRSLSVGTSNETSGDEMETTTM